MFSIKLLLIMLLHLASSYRVIHCTLCCRWKQRAIGTVPVHVDTEDSSLLPEFASVPVYGLHLPQVETESNPRQSAAAESTQLPSLPQQSSPRYQHKAPDHVSESAPIRAKLGSREVDQRVGNERGIGQQFRRVHREVQQIREAEAQAATDPSDLGHLPGIPDAVVPADDPEQSAIYQRLYTRLRLPARFVAANRRYRVSNIVTTA